MKKIIVLIMSCLLISCSTEVNEDRMSKAYKLCTPNDGLKYVRCYNFLGLIGIPEAVCNNGAVFKVIKTDHDK
jgi:hypothetical protein